jgi:hypothetical protein
MGIVALLALMMLMHYAKGQGTTAPTLPPPTPAPSPFVVTPAGNLQPAPAPAVTPAALPVPPPAIAVKVANTPPAWPQGRPADLPPWPSGWTPANPPGGAVVTRAWQLLPVLWARGLGASQAENTAGQWIMYVASWMNAAKTMKGVVAFKPKPTAAPVANA